MDYRNLLRTRDRWSNEGIEPSSPRANLDHLIQYIEVVRTVVSKELHLTKDGQPVDWALAAFHDDVREQSPFPDESRPEARSTTHNGALYITVAAEHANLISTSGGITRVVFNVYDEAPDPDDDPDPFEIHSILREPIPPGPGSLVRTIGPNGGYKQIINTKPIAGTHIKRETIPGGKFYFDGWKALEKNAFDMLRAVLKQLRADYENTYSVRANPTRLADDMQTLEHLIDFLFPSERTTMVPLDRVTREKARRLAKALDIDLPRASELRKKTRPVNS
jgi:hypothetical protein